MPAPYSQNADKENGLHCRRTSQPKHKPRKTPATSDEPQTPVRDPTDAESDIMTAIEKKLKSQEKLFKQETSRLTAATKVIAEQRAEVEQLKAQLLLEKDKNQALFMARQD